MPTSKKPKKKYVKKVSDIIHPFEHTRSFQGQYKPIVINALQKSDFTYQDLLDIGLLLYRWIFIYQQLNDEYSTEEICDFLEQEFLQLYKLHKTADSVETIKKQKINLSDDMRELLLLFVEEAYQSFFLIHTRTQYAKVMKEAIILSNMRIVLVAKHMRHFIDEDFVRKELDRCRSKLNKR